MTTRTAEQRAELLQPPASNSGATLQRRNVMAQDTEPKIGDRMLDGTIYAGISADTGNPVATAHPVFSSR